MTTTIPKIETTVTAIRIATSDKPDWLFQDPMYVIDDTARMQAWEDGEWYLLGIRVRVRVHNWTTGNVQTVESAGLWGIESDSTEDYFLQIAQEELTNIQTEYPQFNDISINRTVTWKYE